MKLYRLSQDQVRGYDTYSDMVVCAESEEARNIHPSGSYKDNTWRMWCESPDLVTVKYLGEAVIDIVKGIICASFHAG